MFTVLVILLCIAALLLSGLSLRRPGIACGLMWSALTLEQLFQSELVWFVGHPRAVNLGIGFVVIAAILFGEHRPAPRIKLRMTAVVILAFFSYMLISTAWAPTPSESFEWVVNGALYFLGIGVVAPHCIRRPIDLRDMLLVTAFFGGVICLALCMANYERGLLVLMGLNARGIAARGNYLETGAYAATVLTTCLGLAMAANAGRWKYVYIISSVVAAVALFRIGARGALYGCAFTLPLLVYLQKSRRFGSNTNNKATTTLLAVLLLVFMILPFLPFFNEASSLARHRLDHSSTAISGRTGNAVTLIQDFIAHPESWMLGRGCGSSWQIIGGYCHVVPVEVLCELGLIGFSLYAAIFWRTFRAAKRIIPRLSDNTGMRSTIVILSSIFALQCLLQCKQGSAISLYAVATFAIMIDIVDHNLREAGSGAPAPQRSRVAASKRSIAMP